jgi:hypothetical protein
MFVDAFEIWKQNGRSEAESLDRVLDQHCSCIKTFVKGI